MKLAMGMYDAPQNQEQPVFYIDNYLNNIAVFGGPMSGKTTFIKTLLIRMTQNAHRSIPEDVYIIDFGGNIGSYAGLPLVCACFDNSNEENIKRVFKVIENRLEKNKNTLGSHSFYQLAAKEPEKCPSHMTLIIENINAFLSDERYASYQDRLMQICRDGLSKGLSVVITGNDLSGTGRLMANFGQKIAFEMPNDAYLEIFNGKVSKPMKIPGRCLANIGSFTYECQMFLPFDTLDDEERIAALLQSPDCAPNPNRMLAFPEALTAENLSRYCAAGYADTVSDQEILVGLDYYEHHPVTVNIRENRSIAIYGKRKFGKTNLLTGMIERIRQIRPEARFVYLDDGRNEVKKLYEQDTGRSFRFGNVLDLMGFLIDEGYVIQNYTPLKKVSTEIRKTPFTVFVLQGKSFYQGSNHPRNLLNWIADDMIARADAMDYLFIYSDVRNMSEPDMRVKFNNMLSSAFLLDNIGEFVADRGNKSVFGEMDAKELKSEYAKCSVGDGYYYDIETDMLKKLKFTKNC